MKNILIFLGTRPEAIKLAGLIEELRKKEGVCVTVCNTAQHTELLDGTLSELSISVDRRLSTIRRDQSLCELGSVLLSECARVIKETRPDLVVVHGDTASAYFAALAAFFYQVPIAHVEAGLRSGDPFSPFPEEFFRRSVSVISSLDFAPTEKAAENLYESKKSGKNIYVTGNTVIDTLNMNIRTGYEHSALEAAKGRRIVLVTSHRRENIGEPMRRIFFAVREACEQRADIFAVCPLHKNPAVRKTAKETLAGCESILMTEPLGVVDFHNIMARSFLVLTDSGGIQEEAAHLGVPVLVARENTERSEGIESGAAMLVGSDKELIKSAIYRLLDDPSLYEKMKNAPSPYGDGKASERIAKAILEYLR